MPAAPAPTMQTSASSELLRATSRLSMIMVGRPLRAFWTPREVYVILPAAPTREGPPERLRDRSTPARALFSRRRARTSK